MKQYLGFFIMALAWCIAALLWLYIEQNVPMGLICTGVGAVNLIVGRLMKKKVQGGEGQ